MNSDAKSPNAPKYTVEQDKCNLRLLKSSEVVEKYQQYVDSNFQVKNEDDPLYKNEKISN